MRRVSPPPPGDTRLPQVSDRADRLLMRLCAADARLLRRHDLPYGSSVLLVAVKPAAGPAAD